MTRAVAMMLAATLAANARAADVHVACSEGTARLMEKFNRLFSAAHPEFKFGPPVIGTPSLALYSLVSGVSTLALVEREIWPLETRPFRQNYQYEPTGVRIGRAGYSGVGRMNPPGIYVNTKNPLRGLSLDQVARIFTSGAEGGDIRRWEQAGLSGDWRDRVIHVYGPRDDGGMASAFRHAIFGGLPFSRQYEPLSGPADVIKAIAEDRYGIGLAGFCDPGSNVRMLPLADRNGGEFKGATLREVAAGAYPLSPYVMVYVNRAPGERLDSFTQEYIRTMLLPEGRAAIESERSSRLGFVPLTPSEAAIELSKLGH